MCQRDCGIVACRKVINCHMPSSESLSVLPELGLRRKPPGPPHDDPGTAGPHPLDSRPRRLGKLMFIYYVRPSSCFSILAHPCFLVFAFLSPLSHPCFLITILSHSCFLHNYYTVSSLLSNNYNFSSLLSENCSILSHPYFLITILSHPCFLRTAVYCLSPTFIKILSQPCYLITLLSQLCFLITTFSALLSNKSTLSALLSDTYFLRPAF